MLLNSTDGLPELNQVHILPPSASTSIHPPVPLILQNPPLDPSGLPPSFASASQDPLMLETLPELLERLNLESVDSLRKYTKKVLHEMVDVLKTRVQGRLREDVQVRLGLLDDQWRDNKLSELAKIKLGCLSSALKNSDLRQADKLHLALMVDHISEVSQWMVGVKCIINELKFLQSSPHSSSPKKLLVPSKTTTSTINKLATEQSVTPNGQYVDTNNFVLYFKSEVKACIPKTASSTQQGLNRQTVKQQNDDINESERTSQGVDVVR